jgi:small GTP-binding protein
VKAAKIDDTLRAKASQLANIATELGLVELADTIKDDTRRRLAENRVRVAVLGEIKQGKSTLVNALVGDDLLPTGVTPTTGAIAVVRDGPAPGAYLVAGPEDGRDVIDEARFRALATGKERAPEGKHIEVVVAGGALPEQIEIIDTPGMNDIERVRGAISRGELPRADVLLLVLDATQLLNRTEMAFLRDAVAAVGGLAGSGARLLLAINRIDLIAQDDRPKLVEHLHREVEAVTADGRDAVEIFQTDARGATRRPDDEAFGVAEVRRLRARLVQIASASGQMLPARARAGLVRHTALVAHNAAIASRAATLERAQLKKEIRAIEKDLVGHESDLVVLREQLNKGKTALAEASTARIEAFRVELLESALATIGTANQRTLSTLLPGSIHDACVAFAQEEAERVREALDALTTQALRTHGEQARRRLFHATLRLGFRGPPIYIDPPSLALEASLVAIGVAGTVVMYFGSLPAGLAMTIAGPLATVFLRERSLRDIRARARQSLPDALGDAAGAIREGTLRVVTRHLSALEEHLVLANVALGEQLRNVLAQAQGKLGEDDATESSRREHAIARYQEIERTLGDLRRELEALPLA